MKRQERYAETNCFHYYNANPKQKVTSDCVVRAIATATQKEYSEVLRDLVAVQLVSGYDISDKQNFRKLLITYGWKKHQRPRNSQNQKMRGAEFCSEIQNGNFRHYRKKAIIAEIGKRYIAAIIDGKIFDIWDYSQREVGEFWTKEDTK